MDTTTKTVSALLGALALADEHGGAAAALKRAGITLEEAGRMAGLSEERLAAMTTEDVVGEALSLGFLAGNAARRHPRLRPYDASTFMMSPDLVVSAAEGDTILRLPWFDDELFVGRQVPDIQEMPVHVRKLCVDNYRAALDGERGRFEFTSYGHAYTVDAIPVRGDDDSVEGVLGVAVPVSRGGREVESDTPAVRPLTPRETEVIALASHGLSAPRIATQLFVSVATVRTHFENIYEKLSASDRAGAVATALRHGLIT
jgi:DNA-binding CsgD family transcriptional regulator